MKNALLGLIALLLLPALASAGVCDDWNALYQRIRDYKIKPAAAQGDFSRLHRRLQQEFSTAGAKGRVFPVVGYDASSGEKGRNWHGKGYRFFTGNPNGIHAAHDLFIHDVDQDSIDDGSGAPVEVVAFSAGVVVGVNTGWATTSQVRGGNYVWVFDPLTERYNYYAHLQRVDVHLGQRVQAGEALGLLGRTGKNAIMPRSPTHLHFMVLAFDSGKMTPYNPWKELVSASSSQLSAVSSQLSAKP